MNNQVAKCSFWSLYFPKLNKEQNRTGNIKAGYLLHQCFDS